MSTNTFNRVYRSDGKYDWCHPNQVEAQFCFQLRDGAPNDRTRVGFVISTEDADALENDLASSDGWLSPFECAKRIKEVRARLWVDTERDTIAALVDFLEAHEGCDALEWTRVELGKLDEQIAKLHKRRNSFQRDIEDESTVEQLEALAAHQDALADAAIDERDRIKSLISKRHAEAFTNKLIAAIS